MSKRWRVVVMLSLLGSISAAGCARSRAPEELPPRAVRTTAARVDAAARAAAYAGGLEPRVKLDLPFGVAGRVRALGKNAEGAPLREGDRVAKGQLLAVLDDADLARQASAAALAAGGAAAELQSARDAAAQADVDLTRGKQLVATGSLPSADLEKLVAASKAAHGRVDAVRAQHLAKLQQLAIAQRVHSDARLVSPADGIVARRLVDAGESVSAAAIAFTIIDVSELRLVVAVPDARIGGVKLGQLVPVQTGALPGAALVGKVTTIHPVADPALRTFNVELTLPNADGTLRAGMVASAGFDRDPATSRRLLVPLSAIVRAHDGTLAVFIVRERRAAVRAVTLGDLVGNDVAVESGLSAGEPVVTDSASFLHDGERVEVLP